MSHLQHCVQRTMTQPAAERLQKEVMRIKTMGHPRAPTLVPARPAGPLAHRAGACRPRTLAAAEAALQRRAGGGGGGASWIDKDTFKSNIPMKWAVGGGPMTSTYTVRAVGSERCVLTVGSELCILIAHGSLQYGAAWRIPSPVLAYLLHHA
jgi:hypothetical protein